jgi:hypothetical protein
MKIMDDGDSENKIICGSTEQNFVSVWGMSLSQLSAYKNAESNAISFDSFTDPISTLTSLPHITQPSTKEHHPPVFQSSVLPKIESSISSQIRNQELPAKIPPRHRESPDEKHAGGPDDIASLVMQRHTSFSEIMRTRLVNIKLVKQSWDASGVKSAVETMVLLGDSAVWIDVLRILNGNHRLVSSLDVCAGLVPVLQELLFEAHQEYVYFNR